MRFNMVLQLGLEPSIEGLEFEEGDLFGLYDNAEREPARFHDN